MKTTDIHELLQVLVASEEVNRAALKVLTTNPDPQLFPTLFRVEVEQLLARANLAEPREARLRELMIASRDRLLGCVEGGSNLH